MTTNKSWNNLGGRCWSTASGAGLKTCPQCRTEIDRRARRCPNCGSKQSEPGLRPILVVCAIALVVGALASTGGGGSSSGSSPTSSAPQTSIPPIPTPPQAGTEMMDAYIKHVRDNLGGGSNCKRAIEDAAKYDLKWKSWGYSFRYFNYYARADGYVDLIGDDAEAQNGFGGWLRVNYSCLYDPATQTVKNVTLEQGRLPSNYGK